MTTLADRVDVAGLAFAYGLTALPMLLALIQRRASASKFIVWPLATAPVAILAALLTALTIRSWQNTATVPLTGYTVQVVAIVLYALTGYAAGRALAHQRPDSRHQRGTVVDFAPSPRPRRDCRVLTLAGHAIAPLDETKHFKLIGTTGTGKSTAIRELLTRALARGDRAIIADPDGGYRGEFFDPSRGDALLNPFDANSRQWDLFAEIAEPYDVDQLARSLIPESGSSTDQEWRGYARTYFTAVTRQLFEAGVRDIGELHRLLAIANPDELRVLLQGTPAQPFLEESNARMFSSIRSVTTSQLAALEYVGGQPGESLSVRNWVRGHDPHTQPRGSLFLPYTANQIAGLRALIATWLRLAIYETMSLPTEDQRQTPADRSRLNGAHDDSDLRRCWFVVDELDALGPIDGLKDALARLRKFGGRCVLGFQSIAQVSNTYGQGEAQTIVENCGNTLILRCSASEAGGTAQFASRLIGEREIIRTHITKTRRPGDFQASTSRADHHVTEPAVLPSEIEQLPDLSGYLKLASTPHWRRVRLRPG